MKLPFAPLAAATLAIAPVAPAAICITGFSLVIEGQADGNVTDANPPGGGDNSSTTFPPLVGGSHDLLTQSSESSTMGNGPLANASGSIVFTRAITPPALGEWGEGLDMMMQQSLSATTLGESLDAWSYGMATITLNFSLNGDAKPFRLLRTATTFSDARFVLKRTDIDFTMIDTNLDLDTILSLGPGDYEIQITSTVEVASDAIPDPLFNEADFQSESYRIRMIPEPSSALLALLGGSLLWKRRRVAA